MQNVTCPHCGRNLFTIYVDRDLCISVVVCLACQGHTIIGMPDEGTDE